MTWLQKWEDLEDRGLHGVRVQSLRRFEATPASGKEGTVQWQQTMGSMTLTCPLVQGNFKEEDLVVKASTCQLQVLLKDKPLAGLNGMLCGTVLPNLCSWRLERLAARRMVRGVDEAFQRITFHLELAKGAHKSWPQLWYSKEMKHPAARSGYAWTPAMEAAQTTAQRTELIDVPQGLPKRSMPGGGQLFAPDDLCVAVDTQQDRKSMTVRVHFDAEALDVAQRILPLEELLAADVLEDRISIYLQSDPQNPIIWAMLNGRCNPKESTWGMTTCDRFRDRQQNPGAPGHALAIVLMKHKESIGDWERPFALCLQHPLMLKNYDELADVSEALRADQDDAQRLSPEERKDFQRRLADWTEERFELMPGAKLLPRGPELGWALRGEEEET
ncbi:unnamed protein product [Durusdinium trenchii]|uniref:CS domain-containing protein n=1 Tax=Durusdinium trenchii TaxID=1381693 RepID=A0ABP0LZS9_9DINO